MEANVASPMRASPPWFRVGRVLITEGNLATGQNGDLRPSLR